MLSCSLDAIPCRMQCGQQVSRLAHDDHGRNFCPNRRQTCDYCQVEFTGLQYDVSSIRLWPYFMSTPFSALFSICSHPTFIPAREYDSNLSSFFFGTQANMTRASSLRLVLMDVTIQTAMIQTWQSSEYCVV